ncbi:hypothetical protein FPK15_contig00115-0004 [Flavobacterium psychrophilum]|nr:hypothetical protein FPK15_contig00115-0004 [Flavobacterium psychrophilum]
MYIDFNNPDNTNIFCIIAIAFSLLFTLGVLKKLSTLLIFFLLFIFKIRVIYLIDGGDNVISVLLPFLFFTNSYSLIDKYEQFSQRIKSKYESYFNITSVLFSFAIMFQICIIYFFAALHKLSGQVLARRYRNLLYFKFRRFFCKYIKFLSNKTSLASLLFYLVYYTFSIYISVFSLG